MGDMGHLFEAMHRRKHRPVAFVALNLLFAALVVFGLWTAWAQVEARNTTNCDVME